MINIGVFFGGTSVEHEVSIITSSQAMDVLKKMDGYTVIPIYITKTGDFYTGESLLDIEEFRNIDNLLKKCSIVSFARGKIDGTASILVHSDNKNSIFGSKNSIFSAKNKNEIRMDIAFPIVHGTGGEDGTLQGMFEMLGIPYIGCNPLSAAITMDKIATKALLASKNIKTAKDIWFYTTDWETRKPEILNEISNNLKAPLIIKPGNVGSSVGVSSVDTDDEQAIIKAIEFAANFSGMVIVEEKVQNLKEINISVCGDIEHIETSVCESPLSESDFLTYEEKYMDSGSKGMAASKRIIPADITDELAGRIKKIAINAFKTIGCGGVTRIDFLYDKLADELYICELNTIPGSLSYYLWEASGVSFETLIQKLINAAMRGYRRRKSLSRNSSFNLLAKDNLKGIKK